MFRNKLSPLLFLSLMGPGLHGARFFRTLENEPVAPNRLIVRLRPNMKPTTVFAAAAPRAHARDLGRLNLYVLEFPGAVSQAKAEALAGNPAVEFVEPDRIRHTTLAPPDDEKYSSQWALNTVEALGAWGLLPARYLSGATPQAQRIKIAVLDSGADCTHPDFRNAGGTSTDSEQGGQFLFRSSKAFIQTTVASPACPSLADPDGLNWSADTGYAGGEVNSTTEPVRGPAAFGLYQTERWGSFLYRFSAPNGTYTVKLKFAEIFFRGPGQRVFGIAINGRTVLRNFDIAAEAGGDLVAIDKQFTVPVVGGYIEIRGLPQKENPKISAIEIVPALQ